MSSTDIFALLPLILTAGTAVAVMLAIGIKRSHSLVAWLTLAGLAAAFISVCALAGMPTRQITALLIIDGYAKFYIGLILASAATVTLLAHNYFAKQDTDREEFYLLLLLATAGCLVLAASSHFASLFLGLEILSVALYGMAGYLRDRKMSLEAGIKYLVLAGASTAFLLFGMALIYADTGTMDFARLAAHGNTSDMLMLIPGVVLTLTGIGFKLALVPFHLWTPDVYEGAPAPVTAFIATASKSAVFAVLVRYLAGSIWLHNTGVWTVLSVISIASMLAGNLMALRQTDVKRVLAYSSIAHLGYALVALIAGGAMAAEAVAFYLFAYTVMSLGSFGVVTVLSGPDHDASSLEEYQGLFWRRPFVAAVFTLTLLSLAGIPATVGFLGKFYVIATGASESSWALILVLVAASTVGLFYYLRIVVFLFSSRSPVSITMPPLSRAGAIVLAAMTVALIGVGVYPAPLLNLIRAAMSTLP